MLQVNYLQILWFMKALKADESRKTVFAFICIRLWQVFSASAGRDETGNVFILPEGCSRLFSGKDRAHRHRSCPKYNPIQLVFSRKA